MKQLAWVVLIVGGLSLPALSAPVYQAGQPAASVRTWLHGEISADYQFASQYLETDEGSENTSALKGWGGRALWAPLPWLSIGAELTQFGDESLKEAFVSSYEKTRLVGLVKFTLSPNTSPRVYLLAGYGRDKHEINYDHAAMLATWPESDSKTTSFWMLGLGAEVNVWKIVFVGVEGNILRHQTTQLPRFYQIDSKTETALRVRAGVRF